MAVRNGRRDIPVLLLHNVDSNWSAADIAEALDGAAELESAMREVGHPVTNLPVWSADLASHLLEYDPQAHVVFNWCESLPGMPRTEALVASTLNERGFAYTGSPAEVLEFSWDKQAVKRLLQGWGVPTPKWRVCANTGSFAWDSFPAIVKPANEHCSLGVTRESVVMTPRELAERITFVLDVFRQPALVEEFVDGREFHVTLWGNGHIEMLPPAEMDFAAFDDVRDRLCTYDAKFLPGSVPYEKIELRLPAPLDPDEYGHLERIAKTAYRALGCRDYGRLDIRLMNQTFYVLDVNPNPDISSSASMAYAAAALGYSYGAMASRLVQLAAMRHPHWF